MSKLIQAVNLGKNIQNLRKLMGMTKNEICSKLDLAGRPMLQSTYAQVESGARNIFVSDLIVLKDILNVGYHEIFKDLKPITNTNRNQIR